MRSAVLLLIFNRPETTARALTSIAVGRPPRLYIAADGPRAGRPGEKERCAAARAVVDKVDWPCEVKTLFREENLGCRAAVSSAISWFFDQEEEGVIVEDDVAPVSSFFRYCDELLDRYRNDPRVAMIGGNNFIPGRARGEASYFFSKYGHIWGWATWRRAWRQYDATMSKWPQWRDQGGLTNMAAGDRFFQRYWTEVFDSAYKGDVAAWSYQWMFACWSSGALCIQPEVNQAENVGFSVEATNTRGRAPRYVREAPASPLSFPLRHPSRIEVSPEIDRVVGKRVFGIGWVGALKRHARRIPGVTNVWTRIKRLQLSA